MSSINPFNAAYSGNLPDLEKWFASPNASLNILNAEYNNSSLLYTASSQGHVNIVKWLLQKGVDPSEPGHDTGSTALHTAAYNGKIEVCKVLLQSGVKTDLKNKFGEIPMACALEKQHDNIVRLLENKIPVLELEGVPLQIPNHDHPLQFCKVLSHHQCDICRASFNEIVGLQGYRCPLQTVCDFDVCLKCISEIFQTQLQHTTSEVSTLKNDLDISIKLNNDLAEEIQIQKQKLSQIEKLQNELNIANEKIQQFEQKWEQFNHNVTQIFGFSSLSRKQVVPISKQTLSLNVRTDSSSSEVADCFSQWLGKIPNVKIEKSGISLCLVLDHSVINDGSIPVLLHTITRGSPLPSNSISSDGTYLIIGIVGNNPSTYEFIIPERKEEIFFKNIQRASRISRLVDPFKIIPKKTANTFFQLWDNSPQNPTQDEILQNLPTNAQEYFNSYDGDIGERCVRLWTSDCVYKVINAALMEGDRKVVRDFMPYIRALCRFIELHPSKEKYTSYRGSKATASDLLADFDPGRIVISPKFTCTSLYLEKAKEFCPNKVICLYNIPKGCPNACGIWELSCFPDENEILFPPYTAYCCLKTWEDSNYTFFSFDVLDNTTIKRDTVVSLQMTSGSAVKFNE